MANKRFYMRVELQLHALTCPGVWLCSHGYLEATIKTLGYYFRTGAMEPRFPLLCHDHFTMEGYFKSVTSVAEMQQLLADEQLEITLWQNGRRLAYFAGNLANVVQPTVPRLSCEHKGNVQLLMKATNAFPGILAPKVELSAQVIMQDRLRSRLNRQFCGNENKYCHAAQMKQTKLHVEPRPVNRHTRSACLSQLEQRRKQQAVCHSRQSQCCTTGCICSFSADSNNSTSEQLRRLSTCSSLLSSNSQTLSQNSATTDCCHSIGLWSTSNDGDEHERGCQICQAYSRVFSS